MNKFFISIILLLLACSTQAQDPTCYNGVKDSLENGVDCYDAAKAGCAVCNGTTSIVLNGKSYTSGITSVTFTQEDPDQVRMNNTFNPLRAMTIKKSHVIQTRFYTKGSPQSGFTLIVKIEGKGVEKKSYKLKSDDVVMFYHASGVVPFKSLKKGSVNISEVDQAGRVFSGTIQFEGKLTDGTSVDLSGALTNIGY